MRSLLAKIAIRKAIGLYLGEHEVAVSEVAATPLGPIELWSQTEPCTANELGNVIERILQPRQGRNRQRLSVGIGLPNSRVFFGTRPLHGVVDPTPEAVLQKLLCSSNISVDDLTIDMVSRTVNKQPLASVAACRKKYMSGVLAVLERCGCQVLQTEPAPCALARAAAQQHRPPRRSKIILQIILGQTEGLAVTTSGTATLAWRPFALSAGSECIAILSAARTLSSQSQYHGLETSLDYVMIHGRADLHESLQKEGLPTELGARVIWKEGPDASSATIALGVALGCLNQNAAAFDLSRHVKPPASLRDIFPWGELAAEVAVVALMGLVLARESTQLNAVRAAAQAACSQNKILASAKPADLKDEKKVLTQKIEAVHDFLGTRVTWTPYPRDITSILPANIRINRLNGTSPFASKKIKKRGRKKEFTITAESPMMSDGTVPPEIGDLLVEMRKHPLLKRDFPLVRLSSLKQYTEGGSKGVALAAFTIVCKPDPTGAAAGGNAGKKGKK